MVGENGEALLTPEEQLQRQQAYLNLTEEELQQRRLEQFYSFPQMDPLQAGQQQDNRLDVVRQAVEEAMPGVYDEIDRIRAGESEEERKKVLHHARGTALSMQGKQVIEIDLASPGFRTFRALHHGFGGTAEESEKTAAKKRYGNSFGKGKFLKKTRMVKNSDGTDQTEKMRFQVSAKERTDPDGSKEYDRKAVRERVKQLGEQYLRNIFEGWDAGLEKTEVCLLLRGYDHGGMAAAESAMMLRYWISTVNPEYLDYVKFELVQHDPTEQSKTTQRPIDLYSDNNEEIFERDGERMMPLGKSAETTVFYSLTGGTVPQSVLGAKRLILTAGNAGGPDMTQKDGAHQTAMADSRTGEVYRGSGINELAAGVYLMDESHTLVRVESYEQAMLILNKLLQEDGAEQRRKMLLDTLKNWFSVQGEVTEEEISVDEARVNLMRDVKQVPFSDGQDSREMTDVKTAVLDLRPRLDQIVGDGSARETLQAAYDDLIGKCRHYEKKKHPWTASGKRRLQMVKTIRQETEREKDLLLDLDIGEMAAMTWRLAIHTRNVQNAAPQAAGAPLTKKKHAGRISRKALGALRTVDLAGEAERRQMRDNVDLRRKLHSKNEVLEAAQRLGCWELLSEIIQDIEAFSSTGVMQGNTLASRHQLRRGIQRGIKKYTEIYQQNAEAMALLQPYLSAFALPEQGRLNVDLTQVPAEQKVNGTDDQLMPKMEWKEGIDVKWADRSEIALFEREPSVHDVQQGMLGDCYLMASIASAVKTNPGLIREMMRDNGDGTVTVRFFKKEEAAQEGAPPTFSPLYVTVKKTVLRTGEKDARMDLLAKNNLWVQMLEKAWAVSGLHSPEGRYDKDTDTYDRDPSNFYEACKEQVKREHPDIGEEDLKKEAKARYSRTYSGAASGLVTEVLPALTGRVYERVDLQYGKKGLYDPENIGKMVCSVLSDDTEVGKGVAYIRAVAGLRLKEAVVREQEREKKRYKKDTGLFQEAMTIDRLKELWQKELAENEVEILRIAEYILDGQKISIERSQIKAVIRGMSNTLDEVFGKEGYFFQEAFSTKTDPDTGETVGNYTEAALKIYNRIRGALDAQQPVTAGTIQYHEGTGQADRKRRNGIAGGHGYSVIGCQERDGFRYVMVRNPWSRYHRNYEKVVYAGGAESINTTADQNDFDDSNGICLLELNDFLNHFDDFAIQKA